MTAKSVFQKLGKGSLIYIGVIVLIVFILAFLSDALKGTTSSRGEFSALGNADARPSIASGNLVPEYSPTLGPDDAKVTIIEFSDFECPFCQASFPVIRQVLNKYPNDVRLVYRHFPLKSIHPNAEALAHASMCAGEQDLFWPFHDRLFSQQGSVHKDNVIEHARAVGADTNRFISCQNSSRWFDEIDLDFAEAVSQGGRGTPTWLVNGELVQGMIPFELWEQIIDGLLEN